MTPASKGIKFDWSRGASSSKEFTWSEAGSAGTPDLQSQTKSPSILCTNSAANQTWSYHSIRNSLPVSYLFERLPARLLSL